MTPTKKLRFVERFHQTGIDGSGVATGVAIRILQQWWENSMTINLGWTGDMPIGLAKGEWRDVPIEKEQV